MKNVRITLGLVILSIFMTSCSVPVREHDFSSGASSAGQPAILEYLAYTWGKLIPFIEIDGNRLDAMRQGKDGTGRGVRNLIKIAPGKHKVVYPNKDALGFHPDYVEFIAEAGKRYKVDFDKFNHKESNGQAATLYYNYYAPVVMEERNGKYVRMAAGAAMPFEPKRDPAGHLLLYEDNTLPMERTARIYSPRKGLIKGAVVFFHKISGDAGATRVEYRRASHFSDPWQLRLLPGNYRFEVTLEGGNWRIANVQSGTKTMTLQPEAGRTYRLLVKGESQGTQFSKDAIGNTQMTTSFTWEPYFEDVTGKGYTDQ